MKRLAAGIFVFSAVWLVFWPNHVAYACCGCMRFDCAAAQSRINMHHNNIVNDTNSEFDDDLDAFQNWVTDEFFPKEIVPAVRMFTTQMNAVAVQQTQIIGAFLDAKNQMETHRLFQELQTEAHKDYIPSDDFCWFGTNIRSMPATMTKARFNTYVLAEKSLDRQLGSIATKGPDSVYTDLETRWESFRGRYCDPSDNNRSPLRLLFLGTRVGTGLELACDHNGPGGSTDMGADESLRTNLDIDYSRLIDLPRTLDVDFTDGDARSDNETDIVAMSENLYGHRVLSRDLNTQKLQSAAAQNLYFALRSVAAKRSVAEYTFNAIVGLKSAGTIDQFKAYVESQPFPAGPNTAPLSIGHTRQYLAAIVRDLYPYEGIVPSWGSQKLSDWDIYHLMGENPSYYSQLEIMGKKMYQNPTFYTVLIDKPSNVKRIRAAMRAIKVMQDRDIESALKRREMLLSMMLEMRLREQADKVYNAAEKAMYE